MELALGGLERILDGHGERTDERVPSAHRGGDDLEIVGELAIELAARARRGGRHNRADDHRRDQNKHREDRVAERDRGEDGECRAGDGQERDALRRPRQAGHVDILGERGPATRRRTPTPARSEMPGSSPYASTATAAWADEASAVKSAIRACTVRRPERRTRKAARPIRSATSPAASARLALEPMNAERRCPLRIGDGAERGGGVGHQSSPGHAGNARLHLDVRRERCERAIRDQVLATEATSEPGEELRELMLVGLGVAPTGGGGEVAQGRAVVAARPQPDAEDPRLRVPRGVCHGTGLQVAADVGAVGKEHH